MAADPLLRVTLAVIIGTLAAIVYSLRVMILMERRVARMEVHLEKVVEGVAKGEKRIESKLTKRRK